MNPDSNAEVDELHLEGDLDPHEAELLRLEIRRLARRHGVELADVLIRPEGTGPPSA